MNPVEFARTIYLGDRYCKRMIFDGKKNTMSFEINMISRIRDASGEWNYYNDENIENGLIVIEGVEKISSTSNGCIINDEIDISVTEEDGKFLFKVEGCFVDDVGGSETIAMRLVAKRIYLVDPKKPDLEIVA